MQISHSSELLHSTSTRPSPQNVPHITWIEKEFADVRTQVSSGLLRCYASPPLAAQTLPATSLHFIHFRFTHPCSSVLLLSLLLLCPLRFYRVLHCSVKKQLFRQLNYAAVRSREKLTHALVFIWASRGPGPPLCKGPVCCIQSCEVRGGGDKG